jgi:hypothetical protein
MVIEDPKTSADETEPEGNDYSDASEASERDNQEELERFKRFIWTEGDFEFEDDA